MSSKKNCFKYNNKTSHWVGHQKLGSLDIYDFFKITPIFYEKQYSVTGNTEEEENTAKDKNDETDENIEANEMMIKIRNCFYNRRREEDFVISRNNEFRH